MLRPGPRHARLGNGSGRDAQAWQHVDLQTDPHADEEKPRHQIVHVPETSVAAFRMGHVLNPKTV